MLAVRIIPCLVSRLPKMALSGSKLDKSSKAFCFYLRHNAPGGKVVKS